MYAQPVNYLFLHKYSAYRRTNEKVITRKGNALFTHKTQLLINSNVLSSRGDFFFFSLSLLSLLLISLLCFII